MMTGMGKTLAIQTSYLGVVKQLEPIIRETYNLMPEININILTDKFWARYENLKALKKEIKKINAQYKKVKLKYEKEKEPKANAIILPVVQKEQEMILENKLYLWIDPLKYEKRTLASIETQQKLKEEFKITNEKIIVAGCLGIPEIRYFEEAAINAIKKQNIKAIITTKTPGLASPEIKDSQIKYTINKAKEGKGIHFANNHFGDLLDIYSIADIAIIGDTLLDGGRGQNPIEPAFYGKKILSGPNFKNNKEAYEGLQRSGLLTIIKNEEELTRTMLKDHEKEIKQQKLNTEKFIQQKRGAAKKYAQEIQKIIYN